MRISLLDVDFSVGFVVSNVFVDPVFGVVVGSHAVELVVGDGDHDLYVCAGEGADRPVVRVEEFDLFDVVDFEHFDHGGG